MADYVFPPQDQPSVAVRGRAERYAVHRIFCVGRNYAAHAREMGGNPDREPPFYFTKPANALLPSGASLAYPPGTQNLHYEMELVIAIGVPVFKVAPAAAAAAVWGYAAGLDMTRRDLQAEAKAAGRPWDTAKGFEHSAVITELVPVAQVGELKSGAITLAVNGTEKQRGDLADMIWSVPEIIANLSQYYHLGPGDLIYTGTPEGVGAVRPGDVITGVIEGLDNLSLTITDPD
jgi:fumarylpyruvate hydrolase